MTTNQTQAEQSKTLIGVSSCLLGNQVRFDGGHKKNRFLTDRLSDHFEFRPLCPEVGIGLGTPRPTLRLVGDPSRPQLVGSKHPELNVTVEMEGYARRTVAGLADLRGFVLKKDSPSCGMERVKVYDEKGMPSGHGSGLFAAELMRQFPNLPVEEEGRLGDAVLRENFISAVLAYDRVTRLGQEPITAAALTRFHACHKFLILAHCPDTYRQLGQRLSDLGQDVDKQAVYLEYQYLFMQAMKTPVPRKRHVNVLQHLSGFISRQLDRDDRSELSQTIDAYRIAQVPLIAPVILLRHYVRKFEQRYLAAQHYLFPYPDELGLRSTI